MKYEKISGWGNLENILCRSYQLKDEKDLKNIYKNNKIILRGNGRSYGDSAIQKKGTASTLKHKKIIFFDKKAGLIRVQSGITLKDLLRFIIPKGWFIPVSPGTKYVTLGGMIASNVHGKNQHNDGCFINYIKNILLILPNKKKLQLSKKKNKEIFLATCGGMGLTGFISEIEFKLIKINNNKIEQQKFFFKDLRKLINTIKISKKKYSVAWIDCFSQTKTNLNSILYVGDHSKKKIVNLHKFHFKKEKNINKFILRFVGFFLNPLFVKYFNFIKFIFERNTKKKTLEDINSFFYPLDYIKNWNELYGKNGFVQYQFVIPYLNAEKEIKNILFILKRENLTPYLAVLKNMKKDKGFISFSLNGVSLALDIPMKPNVKEVINILNKIIISNNGKVYLAKDNFLDQKNFRKMYKQSKLFLEIRKKYHLLKMSSKQSQRIGI
jgi:decaprenylphospho-beta-D-ribofuranose 2-oxidase